SSNPRSKIRSRTGHWHIARIGAKDATAPGKVQTHRWPFADFCQPFNIPPRSKNRTFFGKSSVSVRLTRLYRPHTVTQPVCGVFDLAFYSQITAEFSPQSTGKDRQIFQRRHTGVNPNCRYMTTNNANEFRFNLHRMVCPRFGGAQ